jgi:hypothetical protein
MDFRGAADCIGLLGTRLVQHREGHNQMSDEFPGDYLDSWLAQEPCPSCGHTRCVCRSPYCARVSTDIGRICEKCGRRFDSIVIEHWCPK